MPRKQILQAYRLAYLAEQLSKTTHFSPDDVKALLGIYQKMVTFGRIDRMRMREILHAVFHITDDIMLDLVFHSYDRDGDGLVDELEWVKGLSVMLRGTTDELIEWCYFVYDMNGDGGLAREELHHCLKGSLFPGYGIEADEQDECERELVEIAMKALDVDRDGQITQQDFDIACTKNPLMLVGIGPCLPPQSCVASFLALVTDKYRNYTGPMGKASRKKKTFKDVPATSEDVGQFVAQTRHSFLRDTII